MDIDDEDEDVERRTVNDNANQNGASDAGTAARRGQRRQRPAPNVPPTTTTTAAENNHGGEDDEDDDDDIAIAREKTSLKCPITLLPFRVPVTSRKCPHSFEKEAIFGMISQSSARLGGAGGRRRGDGGFAGPGDRGVQAVKCPVCEQVCFTCVSSSSASSLMHREGMETWRTILEPAGSCLVLSCCYRALVLEPIPRLPPLLSFALSRAQRGVSRHCPTLLYPVFVPFFRLLFLLPSFKRNTFKSLTRYHNYRCSRKTTFNRITC